MSIFKKTKKADMLEGPYLKKMVFFALPVLLTNVLQLLYNHADQIVVGQYNGTEAFASINSTNSLVHLILNLFMGIAVGVNVVVAHSLGAKNVEKARKIVHTSLIAAAVIGVVVGGAGVALSKTFLKWMNSPDDIIGLSSTYLRIYFLGTPFSLVYNFAASAMRAKGDSSRPLIFLTVSGAMNVALNLLFVIVFKMSVAGVAIATVISQAEYELLPRDIVTSACYTDTADAGDDYLCSIAYSVDTDGIIYVTDV
ncbi:MAG: polysaccharide biosynthesis C-terminal domain-containing protein, partial [Clostridia bacterium]|nr:polysaccharide biosynthesis C-terminal domain-containing protein [Clostridia bacterium]